MVAIAVFGGVTCYLTLKQLEWTDTMLGLEDDVYAASRWSGREAGAEPAEEQGEPAAGWRSRRAERRQEREREAADEEAGELDRILAKIADEGLGSLTPAERRRLQRETARRQQEEDE